MNAILFVWAIVLNLQTIFNVFCSVNDILKKIRKYELRIRKEVNSNLQGNFRSIFKGAGIEFDDIRPYQYGDDVRTINWNVTAKGHGTYVKTFIEEKEQTVFFLLDVSASENIGKIAKIDILKEICGVLLISANRDSGQTGVLCFSDCKELYVKPKKGTKHTYEIISKIFSLKTKSKKTDLKKALGMVNNLIKKRSIIIVMSDFIDKDYDKSLKYLSKKHDLIIIQVNDRIEETLPDLGTIPTLDVESGKKTWVVSNFKSAKNKLSETLKTEKENLKTLCKKYNISYLHLYTDDDYVPHLIKFLKFRGKKQKHA